MAFVERDRLAVVRYHRETQCLDELHGRPRAQRETRITVVRSHVRASRFVYGLSKRLQDMETTVMTSKRRCIGFVGALCPVLAVGERRPLASVDLWLRPATDVATLMECVVGRGQQERRLRHHVDMRGPKQPPVRASPRP